MIIVNSATKAGLENRRSPEMLPGVNMEKVLSTHVADLHSFGVVWDTQLQL